MKEIIQMVKRTHLVLLGLFFVSTFFYFGCVGDHKPPSISFYYWKTEFKLTEVEKQIIHDCDVEKLYIRYFDVVMDNGNARPNAPIEFVEKPTGLKVTPVIYIRNNVFDGGAYMEMLAVQIINYVAQIDSIAGISSDEIQVDCDWTESTRAEFMTFLDALKRKANKNITTTIRLHQVKYPDRTGVPPVNRGVLMYYNMGQLDDTLQNSIYERKIAKLYVGKLADYPLPLIPALAIYGWGVHFRNGKVVNLANKIDYVDYNSDTNFVVKNDVYFECVRNNIKGGIFYQRGDIVKVEKVSPSQLLEMASDLSRNLIETPSEVIFFDLDEKNFINNGHDTKSLQKTRDTF